LSPPAAQWSCSRVSEAGHPDNLTQIEDFIEALNARLVVLDPLLSYIGEGVNEYRDKGVRRAPMPVIALAQRRDVALVCLRHVTKAITGSAKHRGNASVAFTNLARSVLFAAPDLDTLDCTILAQSKTNLGPPAHHTTPPHLSPAQPTSPLSWARHPGSASLLHADPTQRNSLLKLGPPSRPISTLLLTARRPRLTTPQQWTTPSIPRTISTGQLYV